MVLPVGVEAAGPAEGSATQVPRKSDRRAQKAARKVLSSRVSPEALIKGLEDAIFCNFCQLLYEKNKEYLTESYPGFYSSLREIVHLKESDLEKAAKYRELLSTCEDVRTIESLSFAECNLTSLPKEIRFFSRLKVINLRHNRLTSLAPLEKLTHLFSINVYGNHAVVIPENLRLQCIHEDWR